LRGKPRSKDDLCYEGGVQTHNNRSQLQQLPCSHGNRQVLESRIPTTSHEGQPLLPKRHLSLCHHPRYRRMQHAMPSLLLMDLLDPREEGHARRGRCENFGKQFRCKSEKLHDADLVAKKPRRGRKKPSGPFQDSGSPVVNPCILVAATPLNFGWSFSAS